MGIAKLKQRAWASLKLKRFPGVQRSRLGQFRKFSHTLNAAPFVEFW